MVGYPALGDDTHSSIADRLDNLVENTPRKKTCDLSWITIEDNHIERSVFGEIDNLGRNVLFTGFEKRVNPACPDPLFR